MIAGTRAEYQLDAESTKDTSYLALTGELWGSFENICDKIDRVIRAPHWIWVRLSSHLLSINNAADHRTTGGVTATTAGDRKNHGETLCSQQDTWMAIFTGVQCGSNALVPGYKSAHSMLPLSWYRDEWYNRKITHSFAGMNFYRNMCDLSEVRCFQIGHRKGLVLYGTLYWLGITPAHDYCIQIFIP